VGKIPTGLNNSSYIWGYFYKKLDHFPSIYLNIPPLQNFLSFTKNGFRLIHCVSYILVNRCISADIKTTKIDVIGLLLQSQEHKPHNSNLPSYFLKLSTLLTAHRIYTMREKIYIIEEHQATILYEIQLFIFHIDLFELKYPSSCGVSLFLSFHNLDFRGNHGNVLQIWNFWVHNTGSCTDCFIWM